MLDANMLIALLSGQPSSLMEHVAECEEGDIVVSVIAFAEVALGSWQGKRPSPTVLEQLSRHVEIVPFDQQAAMAYAQLPFKGGSFDRLIAAHAIALGLTLVTNNEADFTHIPGLRVENWTS
jgi:tRNA(fMet)-specific endonuclease VapC